MKQIFTILFLFIGFLANAQTFQPSKHVVINDALGQAQASPIDGRTMFFDTVNFVWRPFQNTAEVLSYLSVLPTKYRFGNQIIVVDSGGSLQSNGTYLNGHNIFYMFRDSTTNSALVKMWMFNDNPFPQNIVDTLRGLTDSTFSFTQLNGTTNTIKIRGNTQAGNVSSISISSPSLLFNTPSAFTNNSGNWTDTLKFANVSPNAFLGGPASGTPATPTFRFLTTADLPVGIPNGNLLNPFINLSIGTAGTAPNWGTSSVNLGGILLLNIPYASLTTNGIITDSLYAQLIKARDTVFAKGPALYVPPGVPDTIAMYHATIHQAGYADSLDVQYWNAKQQPIQWPYGSLGGVDSVIFGTNITGSIAGQTITINANNSSTNNIKWLNSLNSVVANTGVGTVYKADSGLLVTLKGSDTVDLKVINDTLFARSGLHAAGIDTIDLGGRLWFNTDLNAHDSVTVTLDSLSAGLYFTVLGNKVAGATDSFLIVTAGGQVLKSAVPTPLTVDSAIWKDNGTYTGSYNLTMGTNTQSFTGSYNGGSGQVNITNNSTNGVAFQISQAGVDNIGEVINETGNAAIGMIISSSGNAAPTGMQINATGAAGAIAIYGSTDIGKAAEFVNNNPNDSNAVQTVETLVQYKGAGSHAGLGTSLDYEFSDSLGYFVVASRLISKWTSSVHGAQNAQTEIWGQNAGTLQQQFTLKSTGQLQMNKYGAGTFTGTPVYNILEDANGNFIEGAVPVGAVDSAIWKNDGTYNNGSHTLTLLTNTQVFTGSNGAVSLEGVNTGTGVGLLGISTNGYGVNGQSTNSVGVYGQSTNQVGTYGYSTGAYGIAGFSTTNAGGEFITDPATTNNITPLLDLFRGSTGTPAIGIGGSIDFITQYTAIGNEDTTNQIVSQFTNISGGSRTSKIYITGLNSAVKDTLLTGYGNGQVQLNKYPGAFTTSDTTTHKPVSMDASGNLYQETYWPGSGGGGGTPATPDSSIQYNFNTAFGGTAAFTVSPFYKAMFLGSQIVIGQNAVNLPTQRAQDYQTSGANGQYALQIVGTDSVSGNVNGIPNDSVGGAVAIDAYTKNGGGALLHLRESRGNSVHPAGSQTGDDAGFAVRYMEGDSLYYNQSPSGLHFVALENQTYLHWGTYAKIFASRAGQTGRNDIANFFEDSLAIRNGILGVTPNTSASSYIYATSAGNTALTLQGIFDIYDNDMKLGSDNGAATRSASTTKVAHLVIPTYTSASVYYGGIIGVSNSTDNIVDIGGGSGSYVAATQVNVYTAATNGTTTGTEVASWNLNGQLLLTPQTIGSANTNSGAPLVVTSTFPTSMSATTYGGADFEMTTAGSSSQIAVGLRMALLAGYTGSSGTATFDAISNVAGTGANFNWGSTVTTPTANGVGLFLTFGTTTGYNYGSFGEAENGNQNVGLFGRSTKLKNAATNIGVIGQGNNTGTTPIEVGGYFTLGVAAPTFVSAALIADNAAESQPIFLGRANGTTEVDVTSAGHVLINNTTTDNSWLTVNGSVATAVNAFTGNHTATISDYTMEFTSGVDTCTLPTAVGIKGRIYSIVNAGTSVFINTTSSQTFVNVTATPTTLLLSALGATTVQSDGANWMKLNDFYWWAILMILPTTLFRKRRKKFYQSIYGDTGNGSAATADIFVFGFVLY